MAVVKIRPETAGDIPAIHQLNVEAFGRSGEADLVDALRQREAYTLSLVAEKEGQVVGHILFTPVMIGPAVLDVAEHATRQEAFTAVALGPLAVLPDYQNQGIGSALVEAGLAACHERGDEIVAVLGHPNYYPRFGFVPSVRYGIKSEYDVSDEVFMIMELREGALAGRTGMVRYQAEFNEV
jgi:putative acetyltransferase